MGAMRVFKPVFATCATQASAAELLLLEGRVVAAESDRQLLVFQCDLNHGH